MKKLLIVLLSVIMVLSLASCDLDSILSAVEDEIEQQEQQEKQNTENSDETIGEDTQDVGTEDNKQDNSEPFPNDSLGKVLPKLDFDYTVAINTEELFVVSYSEKDADTLNAYVEKLKDAGFDIDASLTNEDGYYMYSAKNKDDYIVAVQRKSLQINKVIKQNTDAPDDKNEEVGKWPDNEFTRLIPAPSIDVSVLAQDTIGELFTLQVEWTLEQGTEYAQQLADAGFGDDCAEKFAKYGYIDRTANGVNVQLLEIGGKVDISIMPVE